MAEEEKVTAVAEEATSMADYEKELEASFKKLEEGDMITGTVIAVDEEEITLDLRYYTEGIIKVSDYSREPGFMVKEEVHVGDEVTATVIGRDNRRGCILLSRVEANDVLAWDKLRQLKEDKTVLNVTVKGIVSAGVIAYVEGIRGFIPASKLSLNYVEDLNEYLNKEIQVQVFAPREGVSPRARRPAQALPRSCRAVRSASRCAAAGAESPAPACGGRGWAARPHRPRRPRPAPEALPARRNSPRPGTRPRPAGCCNLPYGGTPPTAGAAAPHKMPGSAPPAGGTAAG